MEDLKKYMTLTAEEEEGVAKCLSTLRMAVTPYYLSLIDPTDPEDPVRKQAIPTEKELHRSAADSGRPAARGQRFSRTGTDTPVSGPVFCSLITDQCSMYCRHCTRRRFAGQKDGAVPDRTA